MTLQKIATGLSIVAIIATAGIWAGKQTADTDNMKAALKDVKRETAKIPAIKESIARIETAIEMQTKSGSTAAGQRAAAYKKLLEGTQQ